MGRYSADDESERGSAGPQGLDPVTTAARARAGRGSARTAAIGVLALLLAACSNAVPTHGPTVDASPQTSVLGATAPPTASAFASPSALGTASATPSPGTAAPTLPRVTALPPVAARVPGPGSSTQPTQPPARGTAPASAPSPFGPVLARPGLTVTIAAAGDIACDPAHNVGTPMDCDQAATANLIGQLNPTAVLTLGDNQYQDGTPAAFQAVFAKTWGAYRSIMFPAIGNHEYLTPGAAGYFGYFGVPAYYSYNLGSWHMISLDSECSHVGGCQAGSPQERWLVADLAAHPTACTLVYWHEPRFSSGEHLDATQMTTIWADLVAAHVSVVLSGHNHDYERFVPLGATGAPDPTGVTEFVVGTGGKNHYGFVRPPLTGEVVRNDTSFGVISMTLGPSSYSWRFVPAPGYTFTDFGFGQLRRIAGPPCGAGRRRP